MGFQAATVVSDRATAVAYPAGAATTRYFGLAFDTCTAPPLAALRPRDGPRAGHLTCPGALKLPAAEQDHANSPKMPRTPANTKIRRHQYDSSPPCHQSPRGVFEPIPQIWRAMARFFHRRAESPDCETKIRAEITNQGLVCRTGREPCHVNQIARLPEHPSINSARMFIPGGTRVPRRLSIHAHRRLQAGANRKQEFGSKPVEPATGTLVDGPHSAWQSRSRGAVADSSPSLRRHGPGAVTPSAYLRRDRSTETYPRADIRAPNGRCPRRVGVRIQREFSILSVWIRIFIAVARHRASRTPTGAGGCLYLGVPSASSRLWHGPARPLSVARGRRNLPPRRPRPPLSRPRTLSPPHQRPRRPPRRGPLAQRR
jgi:hypothetical protein